MRPLPKKTSKSRRTPPAANLNGAIARLQTNAADLRAERALQQQSPDARLDTILREIDETVLPRQIILHAGGSVYATLTAANRRLSAIEHADGRTAASNPSFAKALAMSLKLASKEVSHITSTAATVSSDGTETQCSVPQLRKALAHSTQPADLNTLKEKLVSKAIAHLTWQAGADAQYTGDPNWQAFLKNQMPKLTAVLKPEDENPSPNNTAVKGCAIPLSAQNVLVITCTGQEGLAVITEYAHGMATIHKWQARDFDEV